MTRICLLSLIILSTCRQQAQPGDGPSIDGTGGVDGGADGGVDGGVDGTPSAAYLVAITGFGFVQMQAIEGPEVDCLESVCSGTLPLGTVQLYAYSLGDFTGWSGSCSGTDRHCTTTVPFSVSAQFALPAGVTGGRFITNHLRSVGIDAAGLVYSDATAAVALDPLGLEQWRTASGGELALAPDGDVIVHHGATVASYGRTTGGLQWSADVAAPLPSEWSTVRTVVAADAWVGVGQMALTRFAYDGTNLGTTAPPSLDGAMPMDYMGHGVSPNGHIIWPQLETGSGEVTVGQRTDAAGMPTGPTQEICRQYQSMTALRNNGDVVTACSGHSYAILEVTPLVGPPTELDEYSHAAAYVDNSIAVARSGRFAWAYEKGDGDAAPFVVRTFDAANQELRRREFDLLETAPWALYERSMLGLFDVAITDDGTVALGGLLESGAGFGGWVMVLE